MTFLLMSADLSYSPDLSLSLGPFLLWVLERKKNPIIVKLRQIHRCTCSMAPSNRLRGGMGGFGKIGIFIFLKIQVPPLTLWATSLSVFVSTRILCHYSIWPARSFQQVRVHIHHWPKSVWAIYVSYWILRLYVEQRIWDRPLLRLSFYQQEVHKYPL